MRVTMGCRLMPIRKSNRTRYPADWDSRIRPMILERAGHCCEGSPLYPDCRAVNYQPHPVTGSRVVLTIAHLDHTPENCDPANLRAWCQRCHITYDAPYKAAMKVARRLCDNPDALIMLLGRVGQLACFDETPDLAECDRRLRLIRGLTRTERMAVAGCAGYGGRADAPVPHDAGIDHQAALARHDAAQIDLIELIAESNTQ